MNDDAARKKAIDVMCTRHALEALPAVAVSTTMAGFLVTFVLSTEVPVPRLAVWASGLLVIAAARITLARSLKARARSDAEVRPYLLGYFAIAVFASLWWGAGLLVAASFSISPLVATVLFVSIIGMITGGAISTPGTPRTMLTVFTLSMTPVAAALLMSDNPTLQRLLLMAVGLYLNALGVLRQNYNALRDSFRLRLENQELLESVAREKQNEEAARREAERANREKTRFLAAASHDARQPLHALGLFVDMLKAQPLEPAARKLVGNIDLAQGSLVSLHEGLLDLSSLDVGAVAPRPRPVRVRQLLEAVASESSPRARQRGLRLKVSGPDVAVTTDPALALRVLRNLVANALAYTQKGGVLVAARRRRGQVLLQVWDTGIGIAEADQQRIFDELYQVGNPARDRREGLGLGLAIVRRLARALGSEVTVRSVPGKGSVFTFALPASPVELAAAPHELPVMRAPAGARGQVVLLVDDDGLAREALGTVLEGWGYEVIAAQSAEDALEYAAQLERLDVVVTDLWLPGRSGLELLKELVRARPGLRGAVVSGDTAPETRARVEAEGAAFVRKPVRTPSLLEVLEPTRTAASA